MAQEQKPEKIKATIEQQRTLMQYWNNGMRSTKVSALGLIRQCEAETGLPEKYIRKWIGNQNSRARGKRFGGVKYKPKGKPKNSNAYNLFCRQVQVPEEENTSLQQRNKFWKEAWANMNQDDKLQYKQLAKTVKAMDSIEALTGEQLALRQEYLFRQIQHNFDELGRIGVEAFAIIDQKREKNVFLGSRSSRKFYKARPDCIQNIYTSFRTYLNQVAQSKTSEDGANSSDTAPTDMNEPLITVSAPIIANSNHAISEALLNNFSSNNKEISTQGTEHHSVESNDNTKIEVPGRNLFRTRSAERKHSGEIKTTSNQDTGLIVPPEKQGGIALSDEQFSCLTELLSRRIQTTVENVVEAVVDRKLSGIIPDNHDDDSSHHGRLNQASDNRWDDSGPDGEEDEEMSTS